DLVGENLRGVRRPEARPDTGVQGDVALDDPVHRRAVDEDLLARAAEPADGEHARAADHAVDLAERVVELGGVDAVALAARGGAGGPDGMGSGRADAGSARSRAANGPRRRTSSRGSVRRARGTATDAASRWYFPSASALVRSRASVVRLRKSSTRSPVANDGAP